MKQSPLAAATRAREPLWLDERLAERLRAQFPRLAEIAGDKGPLPPPERLHSALRLRQWDALCRSLSHAAANSPHYAKIPALSAARELLRGVAADHGLPLPPFGTGPEGVTPPRSENASLPPAERTSRAVSSLLARLPFTLPEELAAAPESFLAVSHSDVSGVISLPTSGTTGTGKRVFCSDGDLEQTIDFFRHGMQYMARPGRGDHVALLMSGERPGSVGDLLSTAMRRLGVPCSVPGFVPLSKEGEDAMADRLTALAPTCLVGVPGQLLLLARHPQTRRMAGSVRSVLLSGDAVAPGMRAAVASGFDCEVFVHYGLTETGLGGAVECRERNGCHMREADLVHEIVDERGLPVPRGVYGEIVITTLSRSAMPLIRYRTGDEGRIFPDACPCGSVFGRLGVRGRMSDRLSLPDGGSLHITDLDRRLYALPFVQSYSAVLHGGANREDRLALSLRLAHGAPADALAQAEAALATLRGLRLSLSRTAYGTEEENALPVLLRLETDAPTTEDEKDVLRRRQAKQSILRSREEPPGGRHHG